MGIAAKDGLLLATDLADYLVTKGLPFRQAHKVVGQIVFKSIDEKSPFENWALEKFKGFCPLFEADLFDRLTLEGAIKKKSGMGGTSLKSIKAEIRKAKKKLKI